MLVIVPPTWGSAGEATGQGCPLDAQSSTFVGSAGRSALRMVVPSRALPARPASVPHVDEQQEVR
ncbi:hypothetical protein DWV08_07770 [Brachybacterium saurashtrense]|uniref:Uncharacterized protein n=1 Tax=Brachybacterium saurashtrense TaxID=556288 RepID=A0ABN5MT10_9MICO|nr:hypothetical protein DWV08_07770 [Brachybacterium saurashtrense]